MPVRIRLNRIGEKKKPFYRIVAIDSRAPRHGRYLENVGTYNPHTDPSTVTFKEDRLRHWLQRGARPTPIVKQLMKKNGILVKNTSEKAS